MDEDLIEDRIVHDDVANAGHSALSQLRCPALKDSGDIPSRPLDQLEIAQRRIAVADEEDIVVLDSQRGAELEVAAEAVQRRGRSEQLEVARRRERDVALVAEDDLRGGVARAQLQD